MKKIIIAGSRDFDNYTLLKGVCDELIKLDEPVEIVSGGAQGADKLGEQYAASNNIPVKIFIAGWGVHGKAAGPIRNVEMAKYANMLICFWDEISTGSKHMIKVAREYGLEVHIINTATHESRNVRRFVKS